MMTHAHFHVHLECNLHVTSSILLELKTVLNRCKRQNTFHSLEIYSATCMVFYITKEKGAYVPAPVHYVCISQLAHTYCALESQEIAYPLEHIRKASSFTHIYRELCHQFV
jgi:hypothetical protein